MIYSSDVPVKEFRTIGSRQSASRRCTIHSAFAKIRTTCRESFSVVLVQEVGMKPSKLNFNMIRRSFCSRWAIYPFRSDLYSFRCRSIQILSSSQTLLTKLDMISSQDFGDIADHCYITSSIRGHMQECCGTSCRHLAVLPCSKRNASS